MHKFVKKIFFEVEFSQGGIGVCSLLFKIIKTLNLRTISENEPLLAVIWFYGVNMKFGRPVREFSRETKLNQNRNANETVDVSD